MSKTAIVDKIHAFREHLRSVFSHLFCFPFFFIFSCFSSFCTLCQMLPLSLDWSLLISLRFSLIFIDSILSKFDHLYLDTVKCIFMILGMVKR
jgi:hypothetical protein